MIGARAAAAAALFAAIVSGPAVAQRLTPSQLAPAMAAYVEKKIEERGELMGCAAALPKLRDVVPAAWGEWRRTLVALLWANDFPAAHVNAMELRTDPAKLDGGSSAPSTAACQSAASTGVAEKLAAGAWDKEARDVFRRQEMNGDVAPATDDQRKRFADLLAREKIAQTKLLNCLALVDPQFLGVTMNDWAKLVAQARAAAQAKGLPRDALAAQLGALEPNALLGSLPRDRAEARKSCDADQDWQKRLGEFRMMAFAGDVREIFTGKR